MWLTDHDCPLQIKVNTYNITPIFMFSSSGFRYQISSGKIPYASKFYDEDKVH